MIDAARASTNTYFLQLSQQIGLCPIATDRRPKLGMYDAQTSKPLEQVVSFTLGVGYVTPLMLSNAYATFAARGKYCKPLVVTRSPNKGGKRLDSHAGSELSAGALADGRGRRQLRC